MDDKIELIESTLTQLSALVVVVGMLGNVIAFAIFSRPKFQTTMFSVYFRVLIVFDSIVLLVACRSYLTPDSLLIGLLVQMDALCFSLHVIHLLGLASSPISGYILAVVAFDRFMSITFPKRFTIFNTKKFQYSISSLIVATNLLLYAWIDSAKMRETRAYNVPKAVDNNTSSETMPKTITICIYHESDSRMNNVDFVNSSVLPFVLMFVLTVATLIKLFYSRRKFKSINLKRDVRFAFVSIGFNLTFLALTFPYALRNISVLDVDNQRRWLYEIFNFMNLLNFGLTFFLSFFFNYVFRHELANVIRCKK